MQEFIKTQISDDGLRYVSRQSGSPFGALGDCRSTLSCYKCGTHKPRSFGANHKILGKSMFCCFDCVAPKINRLEDEI
ncbi:MAG: hypothetical protein WBJ38_10220 [Limnohabitans sp.]